MAQNNTKATKTRGPGKPFEKGKSGNPGGRPKIIAEIQELAREHTASAISVLVEIMVDVAQSAAARVSAANAILDRGYGKPPQALTGANGDPLMPNSPTINLTLANASVRNIGANG